MKITKIEKLLKAMESLTRVVYSMSDRFDDLEKRVKELQESHVELIKLYKDLKKFDEKFFK